ncbi:MAG: hypothetical protein U1E17_00595 [Geminicoccaceae bacterium]
MRNEPEAKTDARWHPATKLLMGAALLVVPYLWWTSEPDSGAVPATGPAGTPSAAAVGAPAPSLAPYVLPPLEHFTAVVERPLFSPTRRMPPLPEPSSEPQSEPAETPADTPAPSGPAEPELRFFGTVRDRGQMAALVTFPSTNAVARLAPGDKVGAWEVIEVGRDRLVLGTGEERRSFAIFGPNAAEGGGGGGTTPKRAAHTKAAGGTHKQQQHPARMPAPARSTSVPEASMPDEAVPGGEAGDGGAYAEPEAEPPPADGSAPEEGMTDEPVPDTSIDTLPPDQPQTDQ